jgi:hypothetical protein
VKRLSGAFEAAAKLSGLPLLPDSSRFEDETRRGIQLEATAIMDETLARYADLIECSARILAFDGLVEAALPDLASVLTSEAIDLRNGWADFSADEQPGTADLPIVEAVIADVFARANALRCEVFGNMRRTAVRTTDALAQMKPGNISHQTANDVAERMRQHLANLRKQHLQRLFIDRDHRSA